MTRAPSPKPPAPVDLHALEQEREIELTPHFESGPPPEADKPRKPRSSTPAKPAGQAPGKARKPRSTKPGEAPPHDGRPAERDAGSANAKLGGARARKGRAKRESGIAAQPPQRDDRPRKSTTPRSKKPRATSSAEPPQPAATPAQRESALTPGADPLRGASLSHARWATTHVDRFANPAAPPERQRALDSVVRSQAVVVRDPAQPSASPPPNTLDELAPGGARAPSSEGSPAQLARDPSASLSEAPGPQPDARALEASGAPGDVALARGAPVTAGLARDASAALDPRVASHAMASCAEGQLALDANGQALADELRGQPENDIAPGEQCLLPTAEVMPYFPSVPCARCATGVDPLRAACVRATERALQFFCSRGCRDAQRQQEHERARRIEPPVVVEPRPTAPPKRSLVPSVPPSRPPPQTLAPVAQRIVPGRATTPVWPWLAALVASALPFLRHPYATPVAAILLTVVAAVFATRSNASREHAGIVGWAAPVLGVAALSLAAVLTDSTHAKVYLATAAVALLASWAREHWLERAHARVAALRADLDARSAGRVRVLAQDGLAVERAMNSLRVGDQVWVERGMVVPVDGVVEQGEAELLPYPQARLTVPRATGGTVLGGALVIEGALRVRATAVGPKRALFRALASSDKALENAAPSAQRAARVRAVAPGVAAVIGAAACAFITPGTPSTMLAGLGAALAGLPMLAASRGVLHTLQRALIRAATRGVFFRDGAALERAGQLDTVVLRVEGTLVPRAYTLVEVHDVEAPARESTLDAQREPGESLVAWALGAEAVADGHPIARALRRYAVSFEIEPAIVRRLAYTRGAGVSGLTDGQGALALGSRAALLQAGVSVAVADRQAQQAEQDGHKVVLLALGGHVRGLFVFAQELRSEARLAVQSLFDLGLEVALVAGDHRNTVEALARTLDVLQVKAELTREQREGELRRLREGEARVATIGSAADAGGMLTAADVGVCLEGAPEVHTPGDLRAVAHDVLTASSDLRDAAYALSLARDARRGLKQVWALAGVGCGLALLTALSLVPPWACVLASIAIDAACLYPRRVPTRADD